VVDARTGAMWCVSCKGTEALGASSITLTGDGRAALMGSRGAFDSLAADEQDDAWQVGLTPGEPVSRDLLSWNVESGIRGPLALASRSPSYALATAWFDGDVIQVGYQVRVASFQDEALGPPYGHRLAVAFDESSPVARVAVRASRNAPSPNVTMIFDVPLYEPSSVPFPIIFDVPSIADDPTLSPNGVYTAVFAELDGEVDLYRVTVDNESGGPTVRPLTLDLPNPCVIGETCTPPSVDDNGDVVWVTSEEELIHTSTQGGTPTHTSLLPAGVTGRLPALSSNGRFVTYTSSRTDLAGSGADRVFVAEQ
jgi:hypothetical protein